MDAIKIFFNQNEERLVSESVNQSKIKCEEMEIPVEKWIRWKRNQSTGEKGRWCISNTYASSQEKSLRRSSSTYKWTGSTILTPWYYSVFGKFVIFPNTIFFRHTNELRNFALTTQQRKFFICSFEYGLLLVLQDSWCLGLLVLETEWLSGMLRW